MHLRTQTRILPDHCCRYWNIASNGRAKSLKHFLDTAMAKKPWAIFVDSTILVNGYHIYSTACNYNSSVSNLCFACWDASQVFLVVANFPPFLRPIPCPILKSMLENMRAGDSPSLQNRWPRQCHHINAPPSTATTPMVILDEDCGKKVSRLKSQGQRSYLPVLFHSPAQVWLTSLLLLGLQYPAFRHQEINRSLSEDVPRIPRRSLPRRVEPWDSLKLQLPLSKQWMCKQILTYYPNYLHIHLLVVGLASCVWKWHAIYGFHFSLVLHWYKMFSDYSLQHPNVIFLSDMAREQDTSII